MFSIKLIYLLTDHLFSAEITIILLFNIIKYTIDIYVPTSSNPNCETYVKNGRYPPISANADIVLESYLRESKVVATVTIIAITIALVNPIIPSPK